MNCDTENDQYASIEKNGTTHAHYSPQNFTTPSFHVWIEKSHIFFLFALNHAKCSNKEIPLWPHWPFRKKDLMRVLLVAKGDFEKSVCASASTACSRRRRV